MHRPASERRAYRQARGAQLIGVLKPRVPLPPPKWWYRLVPPWQDPPDGLLRSGVTDFAGDVEPASSG